MYPLLPDILQGYGWVSTVVWLLYGATILGLIGVIISENRSPVKSLAWTTILLLLPLVGIVLYIFFGRSIKNRRMISRRLSRKLRKYERMRGENNRNLRLETSSMQLINTARSLCGTPFFADNSIEIFTGGKKKFEALKADISRARKFINIQYYIFEDDALGREIAGLLMDKAAQGVAVRLLYDHVGSFKVSRGFFRTLKARGVDSHPFFKVSFPQLGTRINWRNHRKVCIIDGEVGYVGGMNVAQRYIDGKPEFNCWRDTHLRVTGKVVSALAFSFAVDWNFTSGELLEESITPAGESANFSPGPDAIKGVGAQLVTSGPMNQWSNVAMVLHRAIAGARRRVFIQTPYFLPTEGLLKALQTAALAHVDVRIMLPVRADSRMLTHASASFIDECLKAGIKFYFYNAGMLHSKTVIIDDEICSVGSTNFDFRSFEYNFEANLFCYSPELNARMMSIYNHDLESCTRVTKQEWRKRPLSRKALESIVRLLSPVL